MSPILQMGLLPILVVAQTWTDNITGMCPHCGTSGWFMVVGVALLLGAVAVALAALAVSLRGGAGPRPPVKA